MLHCGFCTTTFLNWCQQIFLQHPSDKGGKEKVEMAFSASRASTRWHSKQKQVWLDDAIRLVPPCVGANQPDRAHWTSPRALPLILAPVARSTVTCLRHSTTTVPRIWPVVCSNTARRFARASSPIQPFLLHRSRAKKEKKRKCHK